MLPGNRLLRAVGLLRPILLPLLVCSMLVSGLLISSVRSLLLILMLAGLRSLLLVRRLARLLMLVLRLLPDFPLLLVVSGVFLWLRALLSLLFLVWLCPRLLFFGSGLVLRGLGSFLLFRWLFLLRMQRSRHSE